MPVLCNTGEESLGCDVRFATIQGVVGSELREPGQPLEPARFRDSAEGKSPQRREGVLQIFQPSSFKLERSCRSLGALE